MKRTLIVVGVVIGLLILWNVVSRLIPSYTEYRGEKIKLTRYYFDFDEFKNDPDNIDPSETSRVQRLVIEAPIGKSYATREEMIHATFDIVFPGYGTGGLGDGREEGEGALSGESIEIPRADKMRHIVFQHRGGNMFWSTISLSRTSQCWCGCTRRKTNWSTHPTMDSGSSRVSRDISKLSPGRVPHPLKDAVDLADIITCVGAPLFAEFAKGGYHDSRKR